MRASVVVRASWQAQLVLAGLVVVLSAGWFAAARYTLWQANRERAEASLGAAERILGAHRQRAQAMLRDRAQLLSEDARLRAALAHPDSDEQTLLAWLKTVSRSQSKEVLAVLSGSGKVRAVTGAELRGLDLSTSSLLRSAQASDSAVSAAWVVNARPYDVAAATLRRGDEIVAYLVLGDPVEKRLLEHVHETTGTAAAVLVDNQVTLGVPETGPWGLVFETLAQHPAVWSSRLLQVSGAKYLTRTVVVEGAAGTTRIAFVRPLSTEGGSERLLEWLLWAPWCGALLLTSFLFWRFLRG